jgi:hypothetical protein
MLLGETEWKYEKSLNQGTGHASLITMESHGDFRRHTLCRAWEVSFLATEGACVETKSLGARFFWRTGANFQPQLGRHNQHNRSLALAPLRHTEFLDEVFGARLHPVTKEFLPDFSCIGQFFYSSLALWQFRGIKVKSSLGTSVSQAKSLVRWSPPMLERQKKKRS